MKKYLLICAGLICSFGVFAQTRKIFIGTDKCLKTPPANLGWTWILPCDDNYAYYYDAADNRVRHGETIVKGVSEASQEGTSVNQSFCAKMNFNDGVLDGSMVQNYDLKFKMPQSESSLAWEYNASFAGGKPEGEWTFSLNDQEFATAGVSSSRSCSMTYAGGELVAMREFDGSEYRFANGALVEAEVVKGSSEKLIVKNGYVVNYYHGVNGTEVPMNEQQIAVVERLLAGEALNTVESGFTLTVGQITLKDNASVVMSAEYANMPQFCKGYTSPKTEYTITWLEKALFMSATEAVGRAKAIVVMNGDNGGEAIFNQIKYVREHHYFDSESGYLTKEVEDQACAELQSAYEAILAAEKAEKERIERENNEALARFIESSMTDCKVLLVNAQNSTATFQIIEKIGGIKIPVTYEVKNITIRRSKVLFETVSRTEDHTFEDLQNEVKEKNAFITSTYSATLKAEVKAYSGVYKSYKVEKKPANLLNYMELVVKLQELSKKQEEYLKYFEKRMAFFMAHTAFIEKNSSKKAIVSIYKNHILSYDLSPVVDDSKTFDSVLELISEVTDVQGCYADYIARVDSLAMGKERLNEKAGKVCADVAKAYGVIYSGYKFVPEFTSVANYQNVVAQMDSLVLLQNYFVEFVDSRNDITLGAVQISDACGKEVSDVNKAYQSQYKKYLLKPDFTTVEEYMLKKAYVDSVLELQRECLRFVQLRKDIATKNVEILAKCKKLKKTAAAYKVLYTSFDQSWPAFPDAATCCQSLEQMLNVMLQFDSKVGTSNYEARCKKAKTLEKVIEAMELEF